MHGNSEARSCSWQSDSQSCCDDAMQVCQIQARDAKRSKMPKLLRKFSSRKKDRCCLCLLMSRPILYDSHDFAPPDVQIHPLCNAATHAAASSSAVPS